MTTLDTIDREGMAKLVADLNAAAGGWGIPTGTMAKAADAIKALVKERDEYRQVARDIEDVLSAACNALREKLAASEKDAGRYRYLRDTPPWKSSLSIVDAANVPNDCVHYLMDPLDNAIDVEMGEK